MSLSFDYHYMLEESVGAAGIDEAELQDYLRHAEDIYATVQEAKQKGELGFARLPYQTAEIEEIEKLANAVAKEFKNLVVIGIGGSDLGARAVHRALNHQFYNLLDEVRAGRPRLFFLGDTTDPVAIREVLAVTGLKDTAFAVISKSGNTVEQMSTFVYVRDCLLQEVGEEGARRQIIILTDAEKGTLREIVRQDGYRSLPVPADVGGRYSVLSSVGLFPLAVAGVDIRALLAGAASVDKHDSQVMAGQNLPLLFALLQHLGYTYRDQRISVLMPYSYNLREVGFWYRQLWAESLGKRLDLQGNEVMVGPTPIAAVGPTDQHSQLQLYMEGPIDKIVTFITVKNPATNMTLPEAYAEMEGVSYLRGHSFQEIVLAEAASTAYALAEAGRPSATLTLEKIDAHSLGQLLYFFELAVTYAGQLFHVDAFDQPGVEASKQYMYGLLGRPGFEDKKIPTRKKDSSISLQ